MAARLTELEAVNGILRMLGRKPVNSLLAADLTADAAFALQELRQVNRQVQNQGWFFNSERSVKLTKDGSNRVPLTADVVRVDNAERAGPRMFGVDIIMRGRDDGLMYLYDKNADSQNLDPFDFSRLSEVRVDLVRLFDFEKTPDSFRHYVQVRAGRNVQARIVGDPALYRFSLDDEARALQVLQKEELDSSDANALGRSFSMNESTPRQLSSPVLTKIPGLSLMLSRAAWTRRGTCRSLDTTRRARSASGA